LMSISRGLGGFTLIEVIMTIVIISLVAAVALPKYQDLSSEAKESAVKSSLGNLRSAISTYYASTAARTGGTASWPQLVDLSTPGIVLEHDLPENSFQSPDKAPDSVVEGFIKGEPVGDRGGWAYKPSTGEIWPNTCSSTGGGCSGPVAINECKW